MKNLKELYRKIFKNKFIQNTVLIAGGTAFAQIMSIVFAPIVTRIYPPEQYGMLVVYTSTLGLLSITASLDYEKAIPLEKNDEKAINLLVLSLTILAIVVGCITLLLSISGENMLKIFNSEVLVKYKYFIPVGILFTGIYNISLQWAFRTRNYKSITKTKINQSISSNVFKVILGLLKIGPIGLILGSISGQSAGITTLSAPILKNKNLIKKVSVEQIKKVAKRYIKFPLYSAPSNYVYTAGTQMPVIFLTSLFGSSVVGVFGLANSIVTLPMNLIGMSVAQVFYSEAAKIGKNNPQKLKKMSIDLIKKLSIIGILPLIAILAFGPWLFSLVFGSNWYEAGVYAQIISVMIYLHFIILPIGRVLEIFEKQKEGLVINILRLSLIIIVFWITKFMGLTAYQAITLYSVANSIIYILMLIIVFVIINEEIKKQK